MSHTRSGEEVGGGQAVLFVPTILARLRRAWALKDAVEAETQLERLAVRRQFV